MALFYVKETFALNERNQNWLIVIPFVFYMQVKCLISLLVLFHANVPFLYSIKTSENQEDSKPFQRH